MQDTRQEQYVEFAIGDGSYAIKISEIQEIIKVQKDRSLNVAAGLLFYDSIQD